MGYHLIQGDATRLPLRNRSVDFVFGSPPYLDARWYLENGRNLGIARKPEAWVHWMLDVTTEALRVSRGLVVWICAGSTKKRNYQPGPEGLLWEWWKRGGECHCLRPVYWHRNGIPGSGGDQWYRADIEYALAFKRPGKLPYANPLMNGHPPKWAPGGAMSHRLSDGTRRNQWGGGERSSKTRKRNGDLKGDTRPSHRLEKVAAGLGKAYKVAGERGKGGEVQSYIPPELANPGNLLHTNVGGGKLGNRLAHENEAPFPVELATWFIASHCKPGGTVLDPFDGSGTTIEAAIINNRIGIGLDLRRSQCRLAGRRLRSITPGLPFGEPTARESVIVPLPGQTSFLDAMEADLVHA
jgi:hypothetical protein